MYFFYIFTCFFFRFSYTFFVGFFEARFFAFQFFSFCTFRKKQKSILPWRKLRQRRRDHYFCNKKNNVAFLRIYERCKIVFLALLSLRITVRMREARCFETGCKYFVTAWRVSRFIQALYLPFFDTLSVRRLFDFTSRQLVRSIPLSFYKFFCIYRGAYQFSLHYPDFNFLPWLFVIWWVFKLNFTIFTNSRIYHLFFITYFAFLHF